MSHRVSCFRTTEFGQRAERGQGTGMVNAKVSRQIVGIVGK